MKLTNLPKLTVNEGKVPHALPGDKRIAVFLEVNYSYSCAIEEIDFIANNDLVVLEKVTIVGVDPSDPGSDIDLRFSIRPQLTALPPDTADADFLRRHSTVTRKRRMFVLKDNLLEALNVNDLHLNSVKANVQLTYVHIGESDPQQV